MSLSVRRLPVALQGGGALGLWEGAGLGQKVAAAEAVVVELVTQLVAMGQPR